VGSNVARRRTQNDSYNFPSSRSCPTAVIDRMKCQHVYCPNECKKKLNKEKSCKNHNFILRRIGSVLKEIDVLNQ